MSRSDVHYRDEIASMLFGFGDSQQPDPHTVRVIEEVVLRQLRDIIEDTSKNSVSELMYTITAEDLLFSFRHNRHKMQRLVKKLKFQKDLKNRTLLDECSEPKKNVPNVLLKFIESLDETRELTNTAEFDAVKYERDVRAEKIASGLDEKKYYEYNNAKNVYFFSNRSKIGMRSLPKFKKWLDPYQQYNITTEALEILGFLAYGIIANIVDMALIIRENNTTNSNNSLDTKVGNYINSSMFNVPHIPEEGHLSRSELNNHLVQIRRGEIPLTVKEVREVVRRCYTPQAGFLRFNHKSMSAKRKCFF